MARPKRVTDQPTRRRRPAISVEARENQMIALAEALAEKQLSEGTASAQVIAHYLKLGSTKERLEKEKLMEENRLLKAKTKSLESQESTEARYKEALNAMRAYSGLESQIKDSDDYADENL